ncbi:venom peptide isomerase heavy chain-like [Oppia nitens]|uniref:venom peptide isomerase heavy chain-like n=1 Tax=Oppia nitens TaxID=1686743 RepID=UPI0023DBDAEE|nr:venom peptide isomerase heavy chain-like [Oppia nitens]
MDDYPNITVPQCGIGRQSLLSNGNCFQWFQSNQSLIPPHELNNGRNAGPAEVPFAVWIQRTDRVYGSGVIINRRWILTAAHVVFQIRVSDIKIYPGKLFININGYNDDGYDVEKTVIQPYYESNQHPATDLALVKLTVDLPLIDTNVGLLLHPYRTLNGICLPMANQHNDRDELALMAGYGKVTDTNRSDRLRMGYIRIRAAVRNETDYWRIVILGQRYPQYNGTFSCPGDSGAPLYQYVNGRAVLIGIHQGINDGYWIKCHEINDYVFGVFPRVSYFTEWISDTINKN